MYASHEPSAVGEDRVNVSVSERLRITLYRTTTRALSFLLARFLLRKSPDWSWRSWFQSYLAKSSSESARKRQISRAKTVWIHAASAGELEILWSVAREIRDSEQWSGAGIVLTVFSNSGRTRISEFKREFDPVYCGPSPWEGDWGNFLSRIKQEFGCVPALMITAKYEAWPELWGELALRRIPILMVNAESRPSLRFAMRWTRYIFGRLPQVWFSCASESVAVMLGRGDFSRVTGDPRWDRVSSRLSQGSSRVAEIELAAVRRGVPKPWVIVGSAWEEDLDVLLAAARDSGFRGSLFFVPHRPSAEQALNWMLRCSEIGARQILVTGPLANPDDFDGIFKFGGTLESSSVAKVESVDEQPTVVLVQEMGVLAELYSIGQAAWVGGGFRTGLHSVIEPALSNLLIGAGGLALRNAPSATVPPQLSEAPTDSELQQAWSRWRSQHHLGASRRISGWAREIVSAVSAV
ncbi:hypothetical protein EBZ37_04730 [bacterium]|nr:hypothetical protein [bacterium]